MRIKTSGLHIEIGVVYKTLTNVTSALIIVCIDDSDKASRHFCSTWKRCPTQVGTFVQDGKGN